MRHVDLDLGNGFRLAWVTVAIGQRVAADIWHPDQRQPDRECGVAVIFRGSLWDPARGGRHDGPLWTVESWDPLTLSPSIVCTRCGAHGFIRGGRWS